MTWLDTATTKCLNPSEKQFLCPANADLFPKFGKPWTVHGIAQLMSSFRHHSRKKKKKMGKGGGGGEKNGFVELANFFFFFGFFN